MGVDASLNIYVAGQGADPILVSDSTIRVWDAGVSHAPGFRPVLLARALTLTVPTTLNGVGYALLHNPDLRGHTGLARTTDAGKNWQVVNAAFFGPVAADPSDGAAVYGSTATCRFCRSDDSGQTFAELRPPDDRLDLATALAIQPDRKRMWAAYPTNELYVSPDLGKSWMSMASPSRESSVISMASEPGDDGWLLAITQDGRLWVRSAGSV